MCRERPWAWIHDSPSTNDFILEGALLRLVHYRPQRAIANRDGLPLHLTSWRSLKRQFHKHAFLGLSEHSRGTDGGAIHHQGGIAAGWAVRCAVRLDRGPRH